MNRLHANSTPQSKSPHALSETQLPQRPPLTLPAVLDLVERYRTLDQRRASLEKELVICEGFHPAEATRTVEEWREENSRVEPAYQESCISLASILPQILEEFITREGTTGIFEKLPLTRPPQEILASCVSPFIKDNVTACCFTLGDFSWLPTLARNLIMTFSPSDRALFASALFYELNTPLSGREIIANKFGDAFPRSTPANSAASESPFDDLGIEWEPARPAPKTFLGKVMRFLAEN